MRRWVDLRPAKKAGLRPPCKVESTQHFESVRFVIGDLTGVTTIWLCRTVSAWPSNRVPCEPRLRWSVPGKVVFSVEIEAGRRPSEVLLEPLEQALSLLSGESIELVVVGTGPGSYNGARVGIAAGARGGPSSRLSHDRDLFDGSAGQGAGGRKVPRGGGCSAGIVFLDGALRGEHYWEILI